MRPIIFYLILIAVISCNGSYNPDKESDHVNQLNSDRLHSMLEDMVAEIQHYKFTHDPDIDYVALIKVHHVTAIEMAQREKEWGKNEKMITIAKHILDEESKEVDELDSYEHTHEPDNQNNSFFEESQKLLVHDHTPSESGNIDQVFGEILLKHHQSAVTVSQSYLKYGNDVTVRKLAQHVIDHHSRNITELESVIKELQVSAK